MLREWLQVAALICLLVVILAMLYKPQTKEPFDAMSFADTVDYEKSVFNPIARLTDVRKPNFAGTDSPAEIAAINRTIADATRNPQILPGVGDVPVNGDQSSAGLGPYSSQPGLQIPQNSAAMANARRCAEVKSCDDLVNPRYSDCGFCIKGGTDWQGKQRGSYRGGLYLDPSDAADYAAKHVPSLPSIGTCPPRSDGIPMFYTQRTPCTKENNRQICRDVGAFADSNASKCAYAQAGKTFVYQDPPNPAFNVNFRCTTPGNTRTTVEIRTGDDAGQIGGTEVNGSGDGVATLLNVREGMKVRVVFNQPDMKRGAVVGHWEGGNNIKIPFEKTITAILVNGNMTGLDRRLRKFGSLGASTQFAPGVPTSVTSLATWVWTTSGGGLVVECFIPGIFAGTTYNEDRYLQGNLPLIGNPDTGRALQLGPCDKSDQAPGKYSSECLMDLFTSAGGDPLRGGLAKTGLNALNQRGSSDSIYNYLGDLYNRAMTGKDAAGGALDVTVINQASVAMFGFEVGSPCETVVEGENGMGFTPKTAPLDAGCLNYLWNNTGNARTRGNEDRTRSSLLPNTYTSIADRYSGLVRGENVDAKVNQYPFRTCLPTGTMSPVNANGSPNWTAMNLVQGQGVAAVLNTYDLIHRTANYSTGNGTDAATAAQSDALAKCYGVTKVPDPVCPL